ncbi:MAG: PTS sugar transporter subunit IIC, partial [Coprobacillus cateniformis]
MIQALLLGCVAFIGKCDLATGTNMIQRPIVLGPIVGLILGDLEMGIKIGATLE